LGAHRHGSESKPKRRRQQVSTDGVDTTNTLSSSTLDILARPQRTLQASEPPHHKGAAKLVDLVRESKHQEENERVDTLTQTTLKLARAAEAVKTLKAQIRGQELLKAREEDNDELDIDSILDDLDDSLDPSAEERDDPLLEIEAALQKLEAALLEGKKRREKAIDGKDLGFMQRLHHETSVSEDASAPCRSAARRRSMCSWTTARPSSSARS
jgi:hypothetical protein